MNLSNSLKQINASMNLNRLKTNSAKKGFRILINVKGEPREVAKGFALGSFVGMLPFPGFQMLISASLAALLKFNKTAAIAGVFNTNLATGAFVFAFNYWLGKTILGIDSHFQLPEKVNFSFAKTVIEAGPDVFMSLLLGGVITGLISMVSGYHLSLFILKRRSIRQQKLIG